MNPVDEVIKAWREQQRRPRTFIVIAVIIIFAAAIYFIRGR